MPLSIRRMRGSQSHADLRAAAPRKEISLPVTLISTTNMLSYEAPDLATARQMVAARKSSEETTPTPGSPSDVPALTPDSSSTGSSPTVEYNHLSAYFPGPTIKRPGSASPSQGTDADAPAIPQRVASHSKRAHETLARKRSLRNNGTISPVSPSSPTLAPSDKAPQRTSLELIGVNGSEPPPSKPMTPGRHRSPTANSSPFSPELEKLNEVAEDFKTLTESPEDEVEDEDTMHMRKLGLVKIAAADYRTDIGSCYPKAPFDAGFQFHNTSGTWI